MFEVIKKIRDAVTSNTGVRFAAYPLVILGAVLLFMAFVFMPHVVSTAFSLALFLAPLWLPVLLIGAAVEMWYALARSEAHAKLKFVLLEIKPPRSLVKTPLAMETFFASIHMSGGESTWWARFKGSTRPFWSLEIASFEGRVHFFIWTRANYRRVIESQMYAQYPGVQIAEAPDYTRTISAVPGEWGIWGCDFKHTAKEDPLPIKTYVEYGLDKVQEEPEQVDPLSNLIEFMGSIGKGEYLWLQYVIRVHKGEKYKKSGYTWKQQAKELVEEIRKETRDVYKDKETGEEKLGFPNPTKGQLEKIAAIERNVGKLAFDVGIRGIYLAKPDLFNPIAIPHLIGLYKPFTTENWNGIRATKWMMDFDDYPWEFRVNKTKDSYRRKMVEAYRRRQFFYEPFSHGLYKDDLMVMSTEELATIYHIPSLATESPALERIQSATSEAPSNLPV